MRVHSLWEGVLYSDTSWPNEVEILVKAMPMLAGAFGEVNTLVHSRTGPP